jgi:hypothetical protein
MTRVQSPPAAAQDRISRRLVQLVSALRLRELGQAPDAKAAQRLRLIEAELLAIEVCSLLQFANSDIA